MPDRRIRPLIVPIFIPNLGCPHRCIFCEQQRITSQAAQKINGERVKDVLETAVRSNKFDRRLGPEVAFYGGTFTNLPISLMLSLLKAVAPYLDQGLFSSIRVSTRPDAVDEGCLRLLWENGVRTVELGVQSMDERVLILSKRGHLPDHTVKAVRLLKDYGFRVGVQLMPGLPGDSREIFYSTVTRVLDLRPDMVRLYPALVIRGTDLADLYEQGGYQPLGLKEAIDICSDSCIRLESDGIPVIRIGLMSSPSLIEEGQIISGPWHPAFGFLVRSDIYHKKITPLLPGYGDSARIRIVASQKDISLLRGYKNQGLEAIRKSTGAEIIKIEIDDTIPLGGIRVENI